MNARLLNEEINKIKKLSGILNEGGTPTAWVAEFLGLIKSGVNKMPESMYKSDEIKELITKNKITLTAAKGIASIDWAKLSVDEIVLLFQWDHVLNSFRNVISKNKIDLSKTAVDTYKGSFKKIAQAYNHFNETPLDAFKKGFNTAQAGGAVFRGIARNIPYIKRFTRRYLQQLSPEEYKKAHLWFWTGVGDYKSIKESFARAGFPAAVANFTGQTFKKWIFWTTTFTITNFLLEAFKDIPEDAPIYSNEWEATGARAVEAFEAAGLHWIFPVAVVWNEIWAPLVMGGAGSVTKSRLQKHIEQMKSKSERETEALERMKQSTNKETPTGKNPDLY